MDLHVSLIGRKNLSREIYRQLRSAIVAERLRPGDSLPASRELAKRLGVSRTTVTVAYDRLAGEGFVVSRVGAGTFVSDRVRRPARPVKRDASAGVLVPRAIWDPIMLPTAFARSAEFDLRSGVPDASLFPREAWRRLIARELRSGSPDGVYIHPAGHPALREAIARHIAISRGVETTADDVTITSGAQQAIDIVARVLVSPGDRVVVEDPGYSPPRNLFAIHGARITGVPVDADGIAVAKMPRRARLAYVTPSHQYPLGMPMSLSRRSELLAWAERANAAIIEDDYDSEFRFQGRPIEPLQTLDSSGRVIYIGSFSKTMLPTLRLGFVVSPPSLRDAIRKAKFLTDWHGSLLVQAALARFIEDGDFARHLRKPGNVYRARHDLIVAILKRDFSDELDVVPSVAGLHVTAVARDGSVGRVREVVRRAIDSGVAVQTLSSFAATTQSQRAGIVMGYGAIATSRIEPALRRLRACFDGT